MSLSYAAEGLVKWKWFHRKKKLVGKLVDASHCAGSQYIHTELTVVYLWPLQGFVPRCPFLCSRLNVWATIWWNIEIFLTDILDTSYRLLIAPMAPLTCQSSTMLYIHGRGWILLTLPWVPSKSNSGFEQNIWLTNLVHSWHWCPAQNVCKHTVYSVYYIILWWYWHTHDRLPWFKHLSYCLSYLSL